MTSRLGAIVLCLVSWSAAGCAGRARPAEPAPPAETYRGFATFYGPGFAGERTASGERFDPRKMVAAHRTLPFGTRVRVTNLTNGRSVVLTVIDRGPYAGRDTIIDVSQAAAKKLGFIREGRVPVTVEIVPGRR